MATVQLISTRRTRSKAVTVFTPSTLRTRARHDRERFHPSLPQHGRCGVTLVELLLVLSLLVVLMAIALPGVRRWQRSMPLEQAASLLRFQLQETRVAAIRSGEAWCLVLPSAGSPGRRQPLGKPRVVDSRFEFRFPNGIRCEVLASLRGHVNRNTSSPGRIVFHADGTVEPSCVRIEMEDGGALTLNVNRLTGTATIAQSSTSTHTPDHASHDHPGVST